MDQLAGEATSKRSPFPSLTLRANQSVCRARRHESLGVVFPKRLSKVLRRLGKRDLATRLLVAEAKQEKPNMLTSRRGNHANSIHLVLFVGVALYPQSC